MKKSILFKSLFIFIFLLNLPFNLSAGWQYSSYKKYTYRNFRNNNLFQQRINYKNIDYPLLHAAIFYVTNEKRIKHGLKALKFTLPLEIAAYNHSKRMVLKRFFSHNDPNSSKRRKPANRARLAGIKNPKIAENITTSCAIRYKAGRSAYKRSGRGNLSYTPKGRIIPWHTYLSFGENIVRQWMNSPGHRRNILSKKALQHGCGVYFFWRRNFPMFKGTQNFQWFNKVKKGYAVDKGPKITGKNPDDNINDKNDDDSKDNEDNDDDDLD